jgi:hypothetical protein
LRSQLDGKNKRVTVRHFGRSLYVDIREFYLQDGEHKPGKKGIALTVDVWNKLKTYSNDIDEMIKRKQ